MEYICLCAWIYKVKSFFNFTTNVLLYFKLILIFATSSFYNTYITKKLNRKYPENRFQCSSVTQSCLTLCNPMDCSMPGFLVHHQLLELAKTHVHWIAEAIQPTHRLLSPSPPAFNLSQHQGLFKWVSSLHQVAKVLELQLQHQHFQWIFRTDFFQVWLAGSPCSPRDSQESPPTPQFKSISPSVLSFLYISTLTSIHDYWKNHSFD